jgi:NAD(P)-dependent dehydrogenase (short-subunit alcohol dehydrogenase family)
MGWSRYLTVAAAGAAAVAAWKLIADSKRRMDFRDRVVVITGGSRGLGLVMARQFAAEGAKVAICARDPQELARAAAELRPLTAVFAHPCDLTNAESLIGFLDAVIERLGPVDVLVNNAGVMQVGPFDCMTEEDFAKALDIHLWAPLRATWHVLPEMRKRGSGRIVNIASIGGEISVAHMLPYCASKFALVGLSDGLRIELAHEGVYVTTVCPWLMRTGSPRNARFKGQHRKEYAWFSMLAGAPLLTISAERAAAQVLRACRYGRPRLNIAMPAKVLTRLAALMPSLTAEVMAAGQTILPKPGGIGDRDVSGADSASPWSPSVLTALNDTAALRNNEQ